jgi:multidrug efflux system outer membrane protein
MLVLVLGGCMMGPDYRRPAVEAPQSWRVEEREAADLANTVWWEQFGDPVLSDLIRSALKENKDLKIAAARIDEFMGRLAVARAPLYPQVSGTAVSLRKGLTQQANPPLSLSTENPYSSYQMFLSASWEIDLWGRLRRATEAARAELVGTEEGRRTILLMLVTSLAAGYTDLLDLDEQLKIAERTARSREDSHRLFTARYERGLVSALELRQAESEYQAAAATVPLLQKLIQQQENGLSVLIGRNPGPIARGRGLDSLMLPAVPAGLPSELLERRPDIRQAEQNLIAANARIGVARAAYFPVLSLTGAYGVESTDLSRLFTGPAKAWNYATPLAGPIFTAGGTAGLVRAAEAVRQQALVRYQQVIQQAFREVEDALIDQKKSRERLAAQAQQVASLREYRRLAQLRYDNGYTSYLEVLDAERGLFNAELSYLQTKGSLFRALVNVYKAMGGGWIVQADRSGR